MERLVAILLLLVFLVGFGCETARSTRHGVNVNERFKIKNISGIEATVMIVEKAGKHFIRSEYHHGWTVDVRDYAITNDFRFAFISDRAIMVVFERQPDAEILGAVYVINNHGEAVKVDDITKVDITW